MHFKYLCIVRSSYVSQSAPVRFELAKRIGLASLYAYGLSISLLAAMLCYAMLCYAMLCYAETAGEDGGMMGIGEPENSDTSDECERPDMCALFESLAKRARGARQGPTTYEARSSFLSSSSSSSSAAGGGCDDPRARAREETSRISDSGCPRPVAPPAAGRAPVGASVLR